MDDGITPAPKGVIGDEGGSMLQGKQGNAAYAAMWNAYHSDYARFETRLLPAFPWNRGEPEDVARYIRGEDGFWHNPAACQSNAALLSLTGDLMCEPRQHHAYRYGDSYFFHPTFQFVRGILKNSDFAVGNLETTLTDATPYAGEYHRIAGKYHCNAPALRGAAGTLRAFSLHAALPGAQGKKRGTEKGRKNIG